MLELTQSAALPGQQIPGEISGHGIGSRTGFAAAGQDLFKTTFEAAEKVSASKSSIGGNIEPMRAGETFGSQLLQGKGVAAQPEQAGHSSGGAPAEGKSGEPAKVAAEVVVPSTSAEPTSVSREQAMRAKVVPGAAEPVSPPAVAPSVLPAVPDALKSRVNPAGAAAKTTNKSSDKKLPKSAPEDPMKPVVAPPSIDPPTSPIAPCTLIPERTITLATAGQAGPPVSNAGTDVGLRPTALTGGNEATQSTVQGSADTVTAAGGRQIADAFGEKVTAVSISAEDGVKAEVSRAIHPAAGGAKDRAGATRASSVRSAMKTTSVAGGRSTEAAPAGPDGSARGSNAPLPSLPSAKHLEAGGILVPAPMGSQQQASNGMAPAVETGLRPNGPTSGSPGQAAPAHAAPSVAASAPTAEAGAPKTLFAGPQRLEVGIDGGVHGWLRVRAELGHAGEVTASVVATSAGSATSLGREVSAMSAYLKAESVGVASVRVMSAQADLGAAMTGGSGAGSAGRHSGERQQGASVRDGGVQMPRVFSEADVGSSSSMLRGGTLVESGGWLSVRV